LTTTDIRGLIPPHPDTDTARRINAAIRSESHYPTQVGVFCDRCGDTVEADYLVGVDDDQAARFEIARGHLRTVGWRCDAKGDLCPACITPAAAPATAPVNQDALCPNGCPHMECYCPDGSEPRSCGHGPGGTCNAGHCIDCDACNCGEDW
jgi:hypothetical protein